MNANWYEVTPQCIDSEFSQSIKFFGNVLDFDRDDPYKITIDGTVVEFEDEIETIELWSPLESAVRGKQFERQTLYPSR